MLYTIVEPFTPRNGDQWENYIEWRQMDFERFDSLDRMLRPSLFNPIEDSDWDFVELEHHLTDLITDFDFAIEQLTNLQEGEIVGLKLAQHDETAVNFLGFDIMDGCFCNSLLSNFGNDLDYVNLALEKNALVKTWETVSLIKNRLEADFPDDSHVEDCRIISIYGVQDDLKIFSG